MEKTGENILYISRTWEGEIGVHPETHTKRHATQHGCLPSLLGDLNKGIEIVHTFGKKYFVPDRLEHSRQNRNLLYWHGKPNEPNKEDLLSFVLFESPFTTISAGSTPPPSLWVHPSFYTGNNGKVEKYTHFFLYNPCFGLPSFPLSFPVYLSIFSIISFSPFFPFSLYILFPHPSLLLSHPFSVIATVGPSFSCYRLICFNPFCRQLATQREKRLRELQWGVGDKEDNIKNNTDLLQAIHQIKLFFEHKH
jgi:hypothetical protein